MTLMLVNFAYLLLIFITTPAARAAESEACEPSLKAPRISPVRIPYRGVEPARSIQIRNNNVTYRITLAMRYPSAQASPLIVQIFYPRNRDPEIEAFFGRLIKSHLPLLEPGVWFGDFQSLTTANVDRDQFNQATHDIFSQIRNRFTSTASPLSSVAPSARTQSAEASEVARIMTSFLRRRQVARSSRSIERILNRAHNHLIESMTEAELRFFDYAIFDEVLPYERDKRMQDVAAAALDLVPPRDLDYQRIHREIRDKFTAIALNLIKSLNQGESSLVQEVQTKLEQIVLLGEESLAQKSAFDEKGDSFRPWKTRLSPSRNPTCGSSRPLSGKRVSRSTT
ncbi:MAG: hypothetical protein HC902_05590 [Calothrix sp. SM1_5_4]|nr:hypothetical protein [Calothrix sp. SM1_5_4]